MSWTVGLADADRLPALGEPLRVIIGPTGAGKSALALTLAQQRGLALISADSRQLYTGFDIGTAKPSAMERAMVPHYGLDVASPEERYSAQRWACGARRWIAEATQAGTPPLIVGGTGFYVRALVHPLAATPTLSPDARDALARWMDVQPVAVLRRFCERLDPRRARLGRAQLSRAIETALLAGVRLGDVLDRAVATRVEAGAGEALPEVDAFPRTVRYLVVDPGPVLAVRIHERVAQMLTAGWVDEVRGLMQRIAPSAPAWLASGYSAMRQHVAGELSLDAASERIMIETRQYAKRQRTWCRHQLADGPVTHISPDDPRATERALAWWQGSEERA